MTIPRRAHFIFAGVITFAVLPGGASAAKAEDIVWHDWNRDRAYHIGDNSGNNADIFDFVSGVEKKTGRSRDDLMRYIGDRFEKTITLKNPPSAGTISISIFSLQQRGEWDCPTKLYFNDEIFDLRDAGGAVGSGATTRTTLSVRLRDGENRLQVVEESCSRGGQNDSLLLEGRIAYGVQAAEPVPNFAELASGIALADASKPDPKPDGYKWFGLKNGSPGYFSERKGEAGGLVQWEDSNGCKYSRPADDPIGYSPTWDCDGRSGETKISGETTPWPLKVGKVWTAQIDGKNFHSGSTWWTKYECKVVDAIRVRVAGGEFDTFKYICADQWSTWTRYYAPSIGQHVYSKRQHSTRGGTWEYVRQEFPSAK